MHIIDLKFHLGFNENVTANFACCSPVMSYDTDKNLQEKIRLIQQVK